MIRRKNKKRRENHETQDENNNAASSDYAAAMPDTGSGCRWRERSEDRSGRTENIPYRWSWKAEAERPAFLPPH